MNPENEEKIYFYTEDLQVGYGGKQILNPVRIGIRKGEILTLVGPNGAGKSTILKSVAAQLPPLGGAVYLDGADLLGMKGTERARRMAVMFTEKVHAEWMTCGMLWQPGVIRTRDGLVSSRRRTGRQLMRRWRQCRYQSFGSGTSRRSATVSGSG